MSLFLIPPREGSGGKVRHILDLVNRWNTFFGFVLHLVLMNKILAFAGNRTPVVPSRRRLHFGAWRTALRACDADMPCVRLPGKFHSSSCCLMSTPCLPLHVAPGRGYGDEIALSRADSKWLLCQCCVAPDNRQFN